jgi:hypothetical protein
MTTKSLFHSIDRTWRSLTSITLTFLPENEADARSFITGLIPFIKVTHSPWFLKFSSKESQLRHLNSVWDKDTRQVYSAEEAELDGFLEDDDELNMMDDVFHGTAAVIDLEHNIQKVANLEKNPILYNDVDFISTFHKVTPSSSIKSTQPSTVFQPKIFPRHSGQITPMIPLRLMGVMKIRSQSSWMLNLEFPP